MKDNTSKTITVAVSGGFDPIHPGHIRMFKEAKSLGDRLVVILNNDNWLMKKKGFKFMSEDQRKEIISSIRWVDEVVISRHTKNPDDMSVSAELAALKPDIMANGGDRNKKDAQNKSSSLYKDMTTCKKYGIKMMFNVGHGGKIESSSWLIDKAIRNAPRKVTIKIKK
jgi:D-beta-D-heptose 7-phosphate kinase/D-beta-D-heptose 1-phosphate adenosyltransferase